MRKKKNWFCQLVHRQTDHWSRWNYYLYNILFLSLSRTFIVKDGIHIENPFTIGCHVADIDGQHSSLNEPNIESKKYIKFRWLCARFSIWFVSLPVYWIILLSLSFFENKIPFFHLKILSNFFFFFCIFFSAFNILLLLLVFAGSSNIIIFILLAIVNIPFSVQQFFIIFDQFRPAAKTPTKFGRQQNKAMRSKEENDRETSYFLLYCPLISFCVALTDK